MIVYESQYARAEYLPKKRLMETQWTSRSSTLDEQGVRNEFHQILECIAQHNPLYILADTRNFAYEVNQQTQNWIVLNFINHIMDYGTGKYAILISPGTFANVSKEFIKEELLEDFEIQYFTDAAEAYAWFGK